MRTFEYRLYPNKEQSHLLMQCLIESRKLYNEMLETVKAQYEDKGAFPSKYDLTAQFKGRGGEHVPATTVQMLADRLTKALKRFLAAKELGLPKGGFPRFKKPNRWHSIQLRQYGTSRDAWLDADGKHLHVPAKLGKLLKIKCSMIPSCCGTWANLGRDSLISLTAAAGQDHQTQTAPASRWDSQDGTPRPSCRRTLVRPHRL